MGKTTHPIRFTTWCFTTRMEPKPASHMWSLKPPPCLNFYLPTRGDPVFSRFILMTEQGLPNLDSLWSTWTRPNWSNPKIPIYQIDDFDVPSLFTSSRCFEGVFCGLFPSIPASNSSTMPWSLSAVITREVHCSRLEWLDTATFLFLICMMYNKEENLSTQWYL